MNYARETQRFPEEVNPSLVKVSELHFGRILAGRSKKKMHAKGKYTWDFLLWLHQGISLLSLSTRKSFIFGFTHCLQSNIPKSSIHTWMILLIQAVQHSSLEIRVLSCDAVYYISENTADIPASFLKSTIPELLSLSKDKNTSIKCAAEVSLVSLLKSGSDTTRYQVSLYFNPFLCN